jgi:hypothetical protein
MTFRVLDPTNEMKGVGGQPAARPLSLQGKTVGFGLDVDHPFNRVAGHGRLGGNHRANGRGSALGICDDCGRAACKPIDGWRRAYLDGSRASPLLEPVLPEAGITRT